MSTELGCCRRSPRRWPSSEWRSPWRCPFLQQGDVSTTGMVAALAVASTIVDVSPFSTNGALVLANAPSDIDTDRLYRQMLVYSGIVIAVGPLLVWLLLVVPGW